MLEPLKIKIENYEELGFAKEHSLETPHFPANPDCKQHFRIAFSDVVYIERSDYKEVLP